MLDVLRNLLGKLASLRIGKIAQTLVDFEAQALEFRKCLLPALAIFDVTQATILIERDDRGRRRLGAFDQHDLFAGTYFS